MKPLNPYQFSGALCGTLAACMEGELAPAQDLAVMALLDMKRIQTLAARDEETLGKIGRAAAGAGWISYGKTVPKTKYKSKKSAGLLLNMLIQSGENTVIKKSAAIKLDEPSQEILFKAIARLKKVKQEKQTQKERLRASEERLRAIFKSEPHCVKVFGSCGALLEINPAGLDTLQADCIEQLNGQVLTDLIDVEDRPVFMDKMSKALSGESGQIIVHVRGLRGARRIMRVYFSPLAGRGKGERQALVISVDVTQEMEAKRDILELNETLELKVANRIRELRESHDELMRAHKSLRDAKERLVEQEKLSALGGLVSGLAHELNTPLGNGLLMSTTMSHKLSALAARLDGQESSVLKKSELRQFVDEMDACAKVVTANVRKAGDLVSSLKQVAVDRVGEARRVFLVDDLACDVEMAMTPALRAAKCVVRRNVQSGLRLDGYPGKLGQVISNLISNALIHAFDDLNHDGQGNEMNEKPRIIWVEAKAVEADMVELRISDNGRGISPENRKRIFEPFFSTRQSRGGSGLGLHIVRSIVLGVLGGTIELVDELGKGVCVCARFPIVCQASSNES
jgi:PAS domain S-box-containing protein